MHAVTRISVPGHQNGGATLELAEMRRNCDVMLKNGQRVL